MTPAPDDTTPRTPAEVAVRWIDVSPCGECGAMVMNEHIGIHLDWHEIQVAVNRAKEPGHDRA